MQTIKFLFGLALGLAIGWGVGSLLTPQSGEETRGTIRERIEKIIDEGRSAAEQRMAELDAELQAAKAPRPAGSSSQAV